jgi:catalase (peroxidase I)
MWRFFLLSYLMVAATPGSTRRQTQQQQEPGETSASSTSPASASSKAADHERDLEWWWKRQKPITKKRAPIYDPVWFASINPQARIAYTRFANAVYTFIESGADAHVDDSYQSFAPILLRAAFHSSGSYFLPDGSGGSNGGTIFHHGELEDVANGCIAVATKQLQVLFQQHPDVPLSDAVIIAGTIALDVMNFPRMDLVRVRGGRDMVTNGMTCRDRLPSSDDDPLERMSKHYGLTMSQLTAFIGGAHNFGAAHGKCSGYHGQWTATPLSWFGVGGSAPTFFPDLLREDWRWYEVCTYYNNSVVYKSIDDPFASATSVADHEEEEVHDIPLGCPIMQSVEPLICEEQAMRGCDFEDGVYALGESPCDIELLQFRLKSDFSLKVNSLLLPHAQAFAKDPDKLAEQFGVAYSKVMHLGLDRCGMNGHGCGPGTICVPSPIDPLGGSKVCALKSTK